MFKIFIVEDEPSIREGLKILIEEVIGGFRVIEVAENGKKALSLLARNLPDLIITDIRMKEMNGLEMIKQIRQQYPHIDILIISGYSDFEYAKQAIQYSVADYLLKPINRVEISQFLNRFRSAKEEKYEKLNPTEEVKQERQLIREVKELIEHQLDQNISLQGVADQVHLNHQYLSTLFKSETGVNFSQYVKGRRIEKAKYLLKESNLKIYEIGFLCGYINSKHFISVFKKMTGVTPSNYREN